MDDVRKAGEERGKDAASWIFDGNTSRENYEMYLRLSDDGDPALHEVYAAPDWLSGEWADSPTPHTLQADFDLSDDEIDDACTAYEEAADEAFHAELERVARLHVGEESSS